MKLNRSTIAEDLLLIIYMATMSLIGMRSKKSQLPALFHIYGKDENVGLIERSNRTVKTKARAMTHATPYRKIPKVMTIG